MGAKKKPLFARDYFNLPQVSRQAKPLTLALVLCSFECKHFGLPEPEFPVADELKIDIGEYESNWVLFEQFNNGLGELTKEDWISFRFVSLIEFCLK